MRENKSHSYELYVSAYEEFERIKNVIEEDWPQDFKTIRYNLLRTTIFDESIVQNRDTPEILAPLLKAFSRYCAHLYA